MRYDLAVVTGSPLFAGPVSEWNTLKVQFASWCQYYHVIYNREDKPDDSIIEDDERLDSWLRGKKLEAKKAKLLHSSTGSNNTSEESFGAGIIRQ